MLECLKPDNHGHLDIYELLPDFCVVCPKKELFVRGVNTGYNHLDNINLKIVRVSKYLDELHEDLSSIAMDLFLEKLENNNIQKEEKVKDAKD